MLPTLIGTDIDSVRTIARAALAVAGKNTRPAAPIEIPGWTITDAFLNLRSGLPEFFGVTATRDDPDHADLLVFRAAEEGSASGARPPRGGRTVDSRTASLRFLRFSLGRTSRRARRRHRARAREAL